MTTKLTYDQLSDFIIPIKGIDWPLLYCQKKALVANLTRRGATLLHREKLIGILHVLDALLEAAESAGLWWQPTAPTTGETTPGRQS